MKGNIFLKSGSCDWYRVNLFNIKKGKVHCIALKSCTILWKSIVQSMFQGQFCQQTFHKKLLFMNTYNVYTVRGFIKWMFHNISTISNSKKSLQFLLHLSLVLQSIEKDFSQYWWRCNKVPSSEKVSSKF